LGEEGAQSLDLVFLLLLGIGELKLNAALLSLGANGISLSRAPRALGTDLRKAHDQLLAGASAGPAAFVGFLAAGTQEQRRKRQNKAEWFHGPGV
jgi:hypothetical protein